MKFFSGCCGVLLSAAALLGAADCRAASITLAWDASPEPVTGYTVYYAGQSVIANPSGATSVTAGKVLQYTVSGITAGSTYYFAVKAYNDYGQSAFSNEVSGAVAVTTTTTSASTSTTTVRPSTTTTSASTTTTARATTSSTVRATTTSTSLADTDHDGIPDIYDNCPNNYNPEQLDADGDGIGDACDPTPGCGGCGQPACDPYADSDHDGIRDGIDNCPGVYNPRQLDANNNGIGDCCDPEPGCGGSGQPACDTACEP